MKNYIAYFAVFILANTITANNIGKAETKVEQRNNKELNRKRNKALEFSVGKFHPGPYMPYELKNNRWNNCSAITLCSSKKLYGSIIGVKYIKLINDKKFKNTYIDFNFSYGVNSPIIENNKIVNYSGGENIEFLMFSLVPTYRKYFKNNLEKIYIGTGLGINYTLKGLPTEINMNTPINSQLNFELGFDMSKENKTDIVFGLKHRCSLFGLIGGELRGRQWYTISIRQWL